MEPEFTYYAFISYSHKDEKFARKLHHYLEHYKLPNVLCRKFPHIPKKLRPVFIDTEELEINELTEAISEALNASRFLIVICSENSVKPNEQGINWIDREVRAFLDLRPENAKRVVPVILRDEGGLSAYDCLLPVIQERGILGADVLKKGEERVFSDVVAKMAGLKPDTLWDRHQRELRHKRRVRRILGGIAASLAAAASWYCWDYYVPHVSYYTDYIERDNIPEGLYELTEEQMKVRERHYRFTKQRRLIRKIEYCNSAGIPQNHEQYWHKERSASMRFDYDEGNNVYICTHRNAQGKEITIRGFKGQSVDFSQNVETCEGADVVAQSARVITTLLQDNSGGMKSTIGRFFVQREKEGDNAGIINCELFCINGEHTPARNSQGVGGREYELDALGRPVYIRYLAVHHPQTSSPSSISEMERELIETPKGIAGYRLTYGDDGQIASVTYINKEGNPTLNEENWAEVRLHYDKLGNIIELRFYGSDGKPCLHKNGYAGQSAQYDSQGNRIKCSHFNIDGQPCLNKDRVSSMVMRYDHKGYKVKESFLGTEGKPCLDKDGVGSKVWKYDDRGNTTEEAYYDNTGKLTLSKDGVARIVMRYDELGNRVEWAYYGTNGNLCCDKDGVARITTQYDGAGNRIEQAYFGIDGYPCLDNNGVARVTMLYDARGNRVGWFNFGIDNRPCLDRDGVSSVTYRYNEQGNRIEWANFGTDGKLCLDKEGVARTMFRYDDRGNKVGWSNFGTDGNPCLDKNGIASVTMLYDARGNMIQQSYFGLNGIPCAQKNGAVRISFSYDEKGNQTAVVGHDAAGKEINLKKK